LTGWEQEGMEICTPAATQFSDCPTSAKVGQFETGS
jgi:hypothetical protein